jgi:hypothetical protein
MAYSKNVAQILVWDNLKVPLQKYTHTRKIRTFDDNSQLSVIFEGGSMGLSL